MVHVFSNLRGLLVDLDGVLVVGEQLASGAKQFWDYTQSQGIAVAFVSNAASRSRATITRQLQQLGINAHEEQVFAATQSAALHVAAHRPQARVYVLGGQGLIDELLGAGLSIVDSQAEVVVVGRDHQVSFGRLEQACRQVLAGAYFVALSRDRIVPTPFGLSPGTGAFVAFVEACTGRTATVIGKPAPALFEQALAYLRLPSTAVAMVGDTLETDIIGARRAGIAAILIGEHDGAATQAELRPDLSVRDLAELVEQVAAARHIENGETRNQEAP